MLSILVFLGFLAALFFFIMAGIFGTKAMGSKTKDDFIFNLRTSLRFMGYWLAILLSGVALVMIFGEPYEPPNTVTSQLPPVDKRLQISSLFGIFLNIAIVVALLLSALFFYRKLTARNDDEYLRWQARGRKLIIAVIGLFALAFGFQFILSA